MFWEVGFVLGGRVCFDRSGLLELRGIIRDRIKNDMSLVGINASRNCIDCREIGYLILNVKRPVGKQ